MVKRAQSKEHQKVCQLGINTVLNTGFLNVPFPTIAPLTNPHAPQKNTALAHLRLNDQLIGYRQALKPNVITQ